MKLDHSVTQIPIREMIVSKANKRSVYDAEAIESLHESIIRNGQIYPIIVKRIRGEKFEVIIGSRRLKAAKKAQRATIPAIVLDDISEPDMVILSLTENLHRKDLTPFEEAKAFLCLCKDHNMGQSEIARRVNKSVAFVKGRLKLLAVPEEVQVMICNNKVTLNHVGILASLGKPKDQIKYAKLVAKQSLSEEDLTTLIQDEVKETRPEPKTGFSKRRLFTPFRTSLKLKRFSKFLQTKVRPQLELEGPEIVGLRNSLRQIRQEIDILLRRRG